MPKEKLGFSSNKDLWIVFLGLLGIAGICQVIHLGHSFFFHGDTTYPESAVVQTALWAKDSGRTYPGMNEAPYTPAPYGPLFYVALAKLAQSINSGFDSLLIFGRGVAFASFLLLLIAAYRWARSQNLAPLVALTAPAFILAQIDFADWNVSVRPDLPALLLGFVAFYFLSSGVLTWRRAALAGLFCALAGLIKQSFVALPLAATLWLLLTRRLKLLLAFVAAMSAPVFLVFGWLAWRHEPFMQEILMARYSPTSAASALALLKADLIHFPMQAVLAGLGLVALMLAPKNNGQNFRLLYCLYFFFSWGMGFYIAMAPGASVNAFLECWTLAAVLASLAVAAWVKSWRNLSSSVKAIQIILWICIMGISLDAWRVVASSPAADGYDRLAQSLREHRVLSDIPYLAAHGKQPELLDPSVNHYLELAGHWSSKPIRDELQAGGFDYVIVGASDGQVRKWRGLTLFSDSILREIDRDYQFYCASRRIAVYVPGNRATTDSAIHDVLEQTGCDFRNAMKPKLFAADLR